MNHYNGYSPEQRNWILREYHRKQKAEGFRFDNSPCAVCDDPECAPNSWHSEDYSKPFSFEPPATYVICPTCHGRLHKRFNQPEEWRLFQQHLNRGGYGREFTQWYSLAQRGAWIDSIKNGTSITLPRGRPRNLTGSEWWQDLTLDPESLVAPWARPRPLRPRPSNDEFRCALGDLRPTAIQTAILRFHATQPRRVAAMRIIAQHVLRSDRPADANLAYGTLAHRLCETTGFQPDLRDDGSEVWMSVVAEGWQPEGREYEWVMVPALACLFA